MEHRYILLKKEKGLSLAVFALGIGTLLAFAALAIDLGISNNVQNELQKATNTAALVGALQMEPNELGFIDQDKAKTEAVNSFTQSLNSVPMINNAVLVDPVSGATSATDINYIQTIPSSRAVKIKTRAQVKTYFLAITGIRSLQVNAESAAINCPAYPEKNLPPPTGSIIASKVINPIGGVNANSFRDPRYILGPPDNVPVALGPGGSITMRMPAPIVDGIDDDIYVRELGDLEGYYLYVGIEGAGGAISWNNVSCTGVPTENALASLSGTAAGSYYDGSGQYKFYRSGLFDLGKTCTNPGGVNYTGNVKNAQYIMIVDDNAEDGILSSDLNNPTILFGEHSSTSPGGDIDSVAVLHHSRLIDYNAKDGDNDGLYDSFEYLLGTDSTKADTDSDGINDGKEISGEMGFVTNPRVDDTDGDGINDMTEITNGTNPLIAEKDKT